MTHTTKQLEAMLAAATPGPWGAYPDPCHYDTVSDVRGGFAEARKGLPNQLMASVGGWAEWKEQEANAALIAAAPTVTAELIAARRKLEAVTAERDEAQTDLAKVIMSLPTGKGERAAGAVEGVKMMRARLETKLESLKEAIRQAIDANQTELNLGNYDHDDVCKLQEEAIDVWQIFTAAWEAAQ